MKERPILFQGAMVRAILDGSKMQTRRIVKPQPSPSAVWHGNVWEDTAAPGNALPPVDCPYGQSGERLWVRESWANVGTMDPGLIVYRADYPACVPAGYENVPASAAITWKPSIHMFRKDSRITLEIVAVRVERLQGISEADAIAEGIEKHPSGLWLPCREKEKAHIEPRYAYRDLWESINGAGSWEANPWVWVVEFRRVSE